LCFRAAAVRVAVVVVVGVEEMETEVVAETGDLGASTSIAAPLVM
jgi:hypothetical protein